MTKNRTGDRLTKSQEALLSLVKRGAVSVGVLSAPDRCSRGKVVAQACTMAGMSLADVIAPKRRGFERVARRHLVYYLLKQYGMTYPEIGRLLERDHTSILYGHQNTVKALEALKQ